ncbi:hypothetical protein [Chryseobacterium turcicum]|uniref:Uncharacterized protein n=1 Tax=Chryseobacterium turcicum TaxID=2898076 RepID=A0A9Q3V553_9FLAO|nr:hypothetical protein [Chryseobacterium turcicum]MCD1118567.1 hypothetical protein [Chryseobacterium turcicum]
MINFFRKRLLERLCLNTFSNMFANRGYSLKFNVNVVSVVKDKNLIKEQVFVLMYASVEI